MTPDSRVYFQLQDARREIEKLRQIICEKDSRIRDLEEIIYRMNNV